MQPNLALSRAPSDVRPPYRCQTPDGHVRYQTRTPAQENRFVHDLLGRQCFLHAYSKPAESKGPYSGLVVFCMAALTHSKTRSNLPMFFYDETWGGNQVIFSPQALAMMQLKKPLAPSQWENLEGRVLGWLRSMRDVVKKVRMWDREVLLMMDEDKQIGEDGWMEAWLYYPGEIQSISTRRRMMTREEANDFADQVYM